MVLYSLPFGPNKGADMILRSTPPKKNSASSLISTFNGGRIQLENGLGGVEYRYQTAKMTQHCIGIGLYDENIQGLQQKGGRTFNQRNRSGRRR